jgi:hypothetical protein
MRKLAATAYTDVKELAAYSYNKAWDRDSIYGCSCYRSPTVDNVFADLANPIMGNVRPEVDESTMFYRGPWANAATDFAGYVCSKARCPRGDNPETRNDFNEVQSLVCTANKGTFNLKFRENTTVPISYNSSTSDLEYSLMLLKTLRKVTVTVDSTGWSGNVPDKICNDAGSLLVYIEFETEFGDLPLLTVSTNKLYVYTEATATTTSGTVVISEYQKGTKEDIECSGQGVCDDNLGVCNCFAGYSSSNSSVGFPGNRGDCTYKNRFSG